MHRPAIDLKWVLDTLLQTQKIYVGHIESLQQDAPDDCAMNYPVPKLAVPLSINGVEGNVTFADTMELQLPDGTWAKMPLESIRLRACQDE